MILIFVAKIKIGIRVDHALNTMCSSILGMFAGESISLWIDGLNPPSLGFVLFYFLLLEMELSHLSDFPPVSSLFFSSSFPSLFLLPSSLPAVFQYQRQSHRPL